MDNVIDKSHQSLMDSVYQRQRHIYDFTRKYYLLGRDHLIASLEPPATGTVLEIACGTGRNLIVAANKYPDATFYGFDISAQMLQSAENNISKSNLKDRITLAQADATAFDPIELFGKTAFDRIYISYGLSMIPEWSACLNEAARHLSSAGSLHIIDFGQQERLPHIFKKLLNRWLKKFHVIPRADLEKALTNVAQTIGAKVEMQSLYRDYARYGILQKSA